MEKDLKFDVLQASVRCANNEKEFKEIVDLILNAKIVDTPPATAHDDGVYILLPDGTLYKFDKDNDYSHWQDAKVVVSYHDHKWIVCKHDLPCGETQLLKDYAKYDDKDSAFFMSEIEALNQFDMNACTAHLYERGLAFELKSDELIPALGQLAAMCFFKNDLNDALKAVGGEPLKDEVYWSSSENSSINSWDVGFYSGYVNDWYGKSYGYYVRPCTAFTL